MSYILNKGEVDSNNSTTTPLNSGATWTGTSSEAVFNFRFLKIKE